MHDPGGVFGIFTERELAIRRYQVELLWIRLANYGTQYAGAKQTGRTGFEELSTIGHGA
jgi:hypothetical protein